MIVYRLEDKKGIGPYFNSSHGVDLSEHYRPTYPGFSLDGLREWNTDRDNLGFAGFHTFDALIWWFKNQLKEFAKTPILLSVYDVAEGHYLIGNSKKQTIFDKRHATKIYSGTIPEFMRELEAEILAA